MFALLLTISTALPQQGFVPSQIPKDSYADTATASLVMHARAARERNERLVTGYRAKVSTRMGVGLNALARDRMLYREEAVAQISWHRDAPSSIEFLGARMGVPVAIRGDQIPDLKDMGKDLVIDPSSDYLRGMGDFDDEELVLYPLAAGAEHDYRFAIGDNVTIALSGGKTIRIIGLNVIPRRSDPKLMSGTLWYDADSYNLVRAVYRPARPWDLRRDADSADKKDMPSWLSGQLEVKYVTLDYGLYDNRWWMPRLMAYDGVGTAGAWLGVPFRMERIYSDYEVEGGTAPDTSSSFVPAGRNLRAVARERAGVDTSDHSAATRNNKLIDSLVAKLESNLVIVVPKDTMSLLTSSQLGAPILDMGDLVSENEVKTLANQLKQLPPRPWETHVELPRNLSSLLQKARYNRVEALSLGTSAMFDFGKLQLEASARLGLADLIPNGELALSRSTKNGKATVTGFRRLAAANPEAKPFSAPNSALALIAQRDDGEYFRTLGAELTVGNTNSSWWNGRVYYQQERAALDITDAAVPHLFSKTQQFRPNIVADSTNQVGASLTLRTSKALSRSVTLGFTTTLDASRGEFDFERAAVTIRGYIAPEGPLAVAVSASAGTSTGTISTQSQFFLGGPMSLRGYAGGSIRGESFWLGRVDVGNSFPGARLIGFADVGWAGPRAEFSGGKPLVGMGVGVSLLDGLLRIDLARRLRGDKGYRLEFYIDGVM